jgi:hypothetical protein
MINGMDWDWFNRDGWPQAMLVVTLATVLFLITSLPEIIVVAYLLGWRP